MKLDLINSADGNASLSSALSGSEGMLESSFEPIFQSNMNEITTRGKENEFVHESKRGEKKGSVKESENSKKSSLESNRIKGESLKSDRSETVDESQNAESDKSKLDDTVSNDITKDEANSDGMNYVEASSDEQSEEMDASLETINPDEVVLSMVSNMHISNLSPVPESQTVEGDMIETAGEEMDMIQGSSQLQAEEAAFISDIPTSDAEAVRFQTSEPFWSPESRTDHENKLVQNNDLQPRAELASDASLVKDGNPASEHNASLNDMLGLDRSVNLSTTLSNQVHSGSDRMTRLASLAPVRQLSLAINEEAQQRIVDSVRSFVDEDKKVVVLKLDPPELGKVSVRMDWNQAQLNLSMMTDHSAVKELIEKHLDDLKKQFQNSGMSLGDFSVGVGVHSDHQEFAGDQPQREVVIEVKAESVKNNQWSRESILDHHV
jgi:flagellar hook-length control protein FliK